MCLFVIVWLNMFFCRLCGFDVFYSFFALPLLHCAVVCFGMFMLVCVCCCCGLVVYVFVVLLNCFC